MKQLLIEHFPLKIDKKAITEGISKNGGELILEGIIQRADAKNQNGRIYPKNILEREIENYINGPVSENRATGELDHPDSQVVNLKNVCHRITEVWWDGDDVKAKLLILDTPAGNIVKALVKGGVQIGISSRAMGSVQNLGEGTVEVQDDLSLVCFDIVSEPSTQGAFVFPSGLNENYSRNHDQKYDKVNNLISEIICSQTGICCIR
jgi:hypothetical protein